eukprot:g111.t1
MSGFYDFNAASFPAAAAGRSGLPDALMDQALVAAFEREPVAVRQLAERQLRALRLLREGRKAVEAFRRAVFVKDNRSSGSSAGAGAPAAGGWEDDENAQLVAELLSGKMSRELLKTLRNDPKHNSGAGAHSKSSRGHRSAISAVMQVYAEQYGVSEVEWLQFLNEEMALLADGDADANRQQHLQSLGQVEQAFRAALDSQLGFSVALWTNLAKAMQNTDMALAVGGPTGQAEGDEQAKWKQTARCFENGLGVLALDPERGAELFTAYRGAALGAGEVATAERLWDRQLQIPGPHLDRLLEEYESVLRGECGQSGTANGRSAPAAQPETVEAKLAAARSKVEKAKRCWGSARDKAFRQLLECEQKHATSGTDIDQAARELIAVERKSKDVQRLEWAYLRCCASLAASRTGTSSGAWSLFSEYAEFVASKVGDKKRAVRILDYALRRIDTAGDTAGASKSTSSGHSAADLLEKRLLLAEATSSVALERLSAHSLWMLVFDVVAAGNNGEEDEELLPAVNRFAAAAKAHGDVLRRSVGSLPAMRDFYRGFVAPSSHASTAFAGPAPDAISLSQQAQQTAERSVRAHWMHVEAYACGSLEGVLEAWPVVAQQDVHCAGTAFKALRYCGKDPARRGPVLEKVATLIQSVSDRPDLLAFEYLEMLRHDFDATPAELEVGRSLFARVCAKHNEQARRAAAAQGAEVDAAELWDESADDPMTPFGIVGVREQYEKASSSSSSSTSFNSREAFVSETLQAALTTAAPDLRPLLYLAWVKADTFSLGKGLESVCERARQMFKHCPAAGKSFDWCWAVLGCARHAMLSGKNLQDRDARIAEDLKLLTDLYKTTIQQTQSPQLAKDLLAVQREIGDAAGIWQAAALLAQVEKQAASEAKAKAAAVAKSNKRARGAQPERGAGLSAHNKKQRQGRADGPRADDSGGAEQDDVEMEGPGMAENDEADAAETATPAVMPRGVRARGARRDQKPRKEKKEGGAHYLQVNFGPDAALKVEEAKQTVYVRNIDVHVDEAALEKLVSEHSVPGLQQVRVVRDFKGNPKGWAYLDFDGTANVLLCCEKLHNVELHGRKLFAAPSKPTQQLYEPRVIFVSGVRAGFDLRNFFENEKMLTVKDVRFLGAASSGSTGEQRGPDAMGDAGADITADSGNPSAGAPSSSSSRSTHRAFVEFEEEASVEVALQLASSGSLPEAIGKVERSIPMKDHEHKYAKTRRDAPGTFQEQLKWKKQQDALQERKKQTLYVRGLNKKTTEAALMQFFAPVGAAKQIALMRNEKGKSRGFAYVELESAELAERAIRELGGGTLDARTVQISVSDRPITTKKTERELDEGDEMEVEEDGAAAAGAAQQGQQGQNVEKGGWKKGAKGSQMSGKNGKMDGENPIFMSGKGNKNGAWKGGKKGSGNNGKVKKGKGDQNSSSSKKGTKAGGSFSRGSMSMSDEAVTAPGAAMEIDLDAAEAQATGNEGTMTNNDFRRLLG